MNILMMSNTYLPFVGGVERSIQTFSQEYRRRGHRTVIVAPTFEGMRAHEHDVIRVPAVQHFNGTDFSVQLPIPGVLESALEGFVPDIVHSHHPYLIGDTALRIAAHHGVPIVFTHHTFYERYTHYVPGDSPALKRFVISLGTGYANLCDHVIAPSEGVAHSLRQRGVVRPLSVIPTGIDIATFRHGAGARFRKHFNIPRHAFLLGTVSRLAPEKNISYLAAAVVEFLIGAPRSYFVAVGSGPAEALIDAAARRGGVSDRVVRTGTLAGQELVDAYHAFDVFVFASQTETQGMVLTEAMAAGTPVVSLAATGVDDIVVHTHNGLILDTGTPHELARLMGRYRHLPISRREQMRHAARHTARAFDLRICVDQVLSLYAQVARIGRMHHQVERSPWSIARAQIQTELHLWGNIASATVSAMDLDRPRPPFR